jgi:hypothetical protein
MGDTTNHVKKFFIDAFFIVLPVFRDSNDFFHDFLIRFKHHLLTPCFFFNHHYIRIEGQLHTIIMDKYFESHQPNDDQQSLLMDQAVAIYPQAVDGDISYLFDAQSPSSTTSSFNAGVQQINPTINTTSELPKPSYCLVWKDLSVLLKKNGNKLIDNVSGIARSGRVLALMGPSGV